MPANELPEPWIAEYELGITGATAGSEQIHGVAMPDYDQGTTLPAPPPLTAQFRRKAGADPAMWAAQFLAAYALADHITTEADRLAFVTTWFCNAMDAAAAQATARGFLKPYDG